MTEHFIFFSNLFRFHPETGCDASDNYPLYTWSGASETHDSSAVPPDTKSDHLCSRAQTSSEAHSFQCCWCTPQLHSLTPKVLLHAPPVIHVLLPVWFSFWISIRLELHLFLQCQVTSCLSFHNLQNRLRCCFPIFLFRIPVSGSVFLNLLFLISYPHTQPESSSPTASPPLFLSCSSALLPLICISPLSCCHLRYDRLHSGLPPMDAR